ncbi:voltage-dependent T-type calcium channel subunit alpha-1I-like [Callorhinchus milii]|uniref:voltage-dependent T-type calcium channel subunit alpha-1I-like n=1 Tax=Callorhinchus milii TaxID=7868 RepID=UPI001C3FDBB3|nr:voltage-dependent T-type calcium channel subunit alpha-1I-like [Callorhinchus milii]
MDGSVGSSQGLSPAQPASPRPPSLAFDPRLRSRGGGRGGGGKRGQPRRARAQQRRRQSSGGNVEPVSAPQDSLDASDEEGVSLSPRAGSEQSETLSSLSLTSLVSPCLSPPTPIKKCNSTGDLDSGPRQHKPKVLYSVDRQGFLSAPSWVADFCQHNQPAGGGGVLEPHSGSTRHSHTAGSFRAAQGERTRARSRSRSDSVAAPDRGGEEYNTMQKQKR